MPSTSTTTSCVKLLRCVTYIALLIFGSTVICGQMQSRPLVNPPGSAITSSAAYSEILLRKTELQAELESLLVEYTEDYPKIKETRFELAALQKEIERIFTVKPADAGKLTLALGKLVVRKAQLATELWKLQDQYKEGHPDVKRAARKVEIFERAIKEILGG